MEIVNELIITKKRHRTGRRSEKSGSSGKRLSKMEKKKQIDALFKENTQIYKAAKNRGHATEDEKKRHHEIVEELMRLRAI